MKLSEILGYIGIVTINSAALIPIVLIIANINANISMVITCALLAGLIMLGIRSIVVKDKLQIINCAIGSSLNTLLLALLQ